MKLEGLYDQIVIANEKTVNQLIPSIKSDEALAYDTSNRNVLTLVLLKAFTVLLLGAGVIVAFTKLVNPIKSLTAVMSRMAHDDLTVTVPYTQRSDELGSIARA